MSTMKGSTTREDFSVPVELGVHGAVLTVDGALPEWIELLPSGEFKGRDGRGPFRLSDPVAVVAATRALNMEAGIPIDYDHASEFAATEGRRAGSGLDKTTRSSRWRHLGTRRMDEAWRGGGEYPRVPVHFACLRARDER
jgi:hypothetical protein